MSKKLIIGVAAGVAACVVVGLLSKRTGLLDSLMGKLRKLNDTVDNQFPDFDEIGMNDTIPRGEDKNITRPMKP
ncbi:MAG TPA: hypothetical protein VGB50_00320 [Flavobacterium sp.]|jgi:hypothetical protein